MQAAHLIRKKEEPVLPTGAGDVETSLRDPPSADRDPDLHQGWGTRLCDLKICRDGSLGRLHRRVF